jgi:hypothetical protein
MTRGTIQVVTVLAAFAAVGLVIFLLARRSQSSFESYLHERGFERRKDCIARVVLRNDELHDLRCYRGPLTASVSGDVIVGYLPQVSRKGPNTWFLGVVVPQAQAADPWLAQWNAQDTYRAPDGSAVVLWQLLDTRDNAVLVLDAVKATLPP